MLSLLPRVTLTQDVATVAKSNSYTDVATVTQSNSYTDVTTITQSNSYTGCCHYYLE